MYTRYLYDIFWTGLTTFGCQFHVKSRTFSWWAVEFIDSVARPAGFAIRIEEAGIIELVVHGISVFVCRIGQSGLFDGAQNGRNLAVGERQLKVYMLSLTSLPKIYNTESKV